MLQVELVKVSGDDHETEFFLSVRTFFYGTRNLYLYVILEFSKETHITNFTLHFLDDNSKYITGRVYSTLSFKVENFPLLPTSS